jgi:hypothetical protein
LVPEGLFDFIDFETLGELGLGDRPTGLET